MSSWEYKERLDYIRQFFYSDIRKRKNFNRHEKTWITKKYRALRNIDNADHVFIPRPKTKIAEYKKRGHYTVGKGIFLPRIKTDKLTQTVESVAPDLVMYKIGKRVDIQYNFTKKEKIDVLRKKSIEPYLKVLKKKAGIKYKYSIHFVFTGNNGSLEFTLPELADGYLSSISQSGEKWLTGIRLVGFNKNATRSRSRRGNRSVRPR